MNNKKPTVNRRMSDDRDKAIGKQIRLRRAMLGISQQEVAKRLNISFQQLQKYEKGSNRLSVTRLLEISEILECKFTFLLMPVLESGNHDYKNEDFTLGDGASDIDSSLPNENLEKLLKKARGREILDICRYFSQIRSVEVRRHVISMVRSISMINSDEYKNPESP